MMFHLNIGDKNDDV